MKAYTDINQSKKLAKILPLESADMYYFRQIDNDYIPPDVESICPIPLFIDGKENFSYDIPCWSLAALLGILAEQDFIIKSLERNNEYQYNIDIPSRHCKVWFSSLLDAAFEMIHSLKANNKL